MQCNQTRLAGKLNDEDANMFYPTGGSNPAESDVASPEARALFLQAYSNNFNSLCDRSGHARLRNAAVESIWSARGVSVDT